MGHEPERSTSFLRGGLMQGRLILVGVVIVGVVLMLGLFLSHPPPESDLLPDESNPQQDPRISIDTKPSWTELDNPLRDGWSSEVLAKKAKQQLNQIGQLIKRGRPVAPDELASLASPDFSCGPLHPAEMLVVYKDDVLSVERAPDSHRLPSDPPSTTYEGADGFGKVLSEFVKDLGKVSGLRFEFKIFDVRQRAGDIETTQYFSLSGHTESGIVEEHATWSIRWEWTSPDANPRLRSIRVDRFERVRTVADQRLFSDCTDSVLRKTDSYHAQLLVGYNYWLGRSQDDRYFHVLGNPGISVGDVNGDGLDDLYVCQEQGLPNRLYLQQPDGTVIDTSVQSGVDWLESSRSALLVDLDNDGDQDLVVATVGNLVLAENNGAGQFKMKGLLPTGEDTMSLSAADYDSDGDLDLYVCVRDSDDQFGTSTVGATATTSENFIYYDANNGGRNSLYRNEIAEDSEWRFLDVTEEAGLDVNNRRFSHAAAWEDFDNDGDQDLYVANDYGRNNLFRNQLAEKGSATFVDIAGQAGAEDSASGMSVSWGDYDRDGLMDVYVGNMFSAAGSRITHQAQFRRDAPENVRSLLQRFARGNTLFKNLGRNRFEDVSVAQAVTMGRWAWSSNFIDLNNDGWEDLVVANGFITTEDTGDL